jgi:Spy/CpxP family protein refolding chaperone
MVMSKYKVGLLGLFFCFLLCSTLVLADHGEDDSKGHEKEMSLSCLSNLKLNSEQAEKIRGLNETFQKEVEQLRAEEFKIKTELKLLWMQPHPDSQQIMAKEKAIHDLKWQMKEKSVDYRLLFRNILTPEQLTEYLREDTGYHHKHHKK